MIALGPQVLDECLVPQMQSYILRIQDKMQSANEAVSPASNLYERQERKEVLNLMWNTLVLASRSLLSHYAETTETKRESAPSRLKVYQMLVENFGDSLAMTNTNNFQPKSVKPKRLLGRLRVRCLNGKPSFDYEDPMDIFDDDIFINQNPHQTVAISPKVISEFELRETRTVEIYKPIYCKFDGFHQPKLRRSRKLIMPSFDGKKRGNNFVAIARRMGTPLSRTSSQDIRNSCCIDTVL